MELNEICKLKNEIQILKKELEQARENVEVLEKQLANRGSAKSWSEYSMVSKEVAVSLVICGASGYLASRKTYPSLYSLYRTSLLPPQILIIGIARSSYNDTSFRKHLTKHIDVEAEDKTKLDEFLDRCFYVQSNSYSDSISWLAVHQKISQFEEGVGVGNRLFYLAVPPDLFVETTTAIKKYTTSKLGWNRIILEKPWGHDYESALSLSIQVGQHWPESSIYRIDHYLGKEMVQNLLVLRFSNTVFEPIWNRNFIANVRITFKENFGTDGRGKYFDGYGIIRDVMQNHLMQIFSLIAMEPPVCLNAENIRDEKVKVLKSTQTLNLSDLVIGQFSDYKNEEGVDPNSLTETFAQAILRINNSRWNGVPFIIKCAKGVNERKAEIRIQFKEFPSAQLFNGAQRNELVIRVQPNECIYLKMMNKLPGFATDLTVSDLDLLYKDKFPGIYKPEAYERLILDAIAGDHNLFVRDDELVAAWRILTPVLHKIKIDKISPITYERGSEGPPEADAAARDNGWLPILTNK
eukprot:TRINITY_DN8410_c3_g1_i5.p1 TRINITY_DN8410_c3_g1~~TRINITY_DN8410_c3_g1_i5.p1  ORF type:complete len:523 (+),score=128.48 TRINITY_DN8410_c3_g1_i5:131-1699(+)